MIEGSAYFVLTPLGKSTLGPLILHIHFPAYMPEVDLTGLIVPTCWHGVEKWYSFALPGLTMPGLTTAALFVDGWWNKAAVAGEVDSGTLDSFLCLTKAAGAAASDWSNVCTETLSPGIPRNLAIVAFASMIEGSAYFVLTPLGKSTLGPLILQLHSPACLPVVEFTGLIVPTCWHGVEKLKLQPLLAFFFWVTGVLIITAAWAGDFSCRGDDAIKYFDPPFTITVSNGIPRNLAIPAFASLIEGKV